ncbi:phosphatase PAP2 family protein [Patescibacteria group bacterium]|nr:MAG: phosphatase PAP2 family protein [Patescibacteria group bacterium]
MRDQIYYFLQIGGAYFVLCLLPILLFMLWRVLTSFFVDSREQFWERFAIIGRFTLMLVAWFFTFSFSLMLINWLAGAPTDRIVRASDGAAALDRQIFGVDVPFWLQQSNNPWKSFFDAIGPLTIAVYKGLGILIGLTACVTLMTKFSVFLRFGIGFLLAIIISLPVWYAFPAIIPMERYLENTSGAPIPMPTQTALNQYAPSPALHEFIGEVREVQSGGTQGVTTMPSMHVAWALIASFCLFQLWKPTLILTVPYNILNMLATVYTLEHYAIDIFGGIVVAVTVLWLTNRFVTPAPHKKQLTDLMHETVQSIVPTLKELAFQFSKSKR